MSPPVMKSGEGPMLVYAACPSRLDDQRPSIVGFVSGHGHGCLHPFNALPRDAFEDNPRIGRVSTLNWCLRLVDAADELWLFGVSEGTMTELEYYIRTRPEGRVRFCLAFDIEWPVQMTALENRFPIATERIKSDRLKPAQLLQR